MVKRILGWIDAVNEWIGRAVSWIILIMTLLIVGEVIMRRFLNRPTVWNFETVIQLYGLYFMALAAYGLLHGSHVSIDFIYVKFSARTRARLDVLSYLMFFFPFCAVLLWQGAIFARTAWTIGERSPSVFAPPLAPIKTVIPVTAALLILQGAAIFIRRMGVLIRGGDDA